MPYCTDSSCNLLRTGYVGRANVRPRRCPTHLKSGLRFLVVHARWHSQKLQAQEPQGKGHKCAEYACIQTQSRAGCCHGRMGVQGRTHSAKKRTLQIPAQTQADIGILIASHGGKWRSGKTYCENGSPIPPTRRYRASSPIRRTCVPRLQGFVSAEKSSSRALRLSVFIICAN